MPRLKVNRDVLHLTRLARSDLGRRFILYIGSAPTVTNVAPSPMDPINKSTPDTDTVIMGAGVFEEISNDVQDEATGSVVKRKASLLVHPTYEPYFQKGYAVKIGQEVGLFDLLGVDTDTTRMITTVSLQARQ